MKAKVADLYSRMTNYDISVFTFFWCDVAQQLAFIHKRVQERKLQISDVGKSITLLCTHLRDDYPLSYEMPEELLIANGFSSHILHQFWGKDYSTGIIYCKK